MQDAASQMGPLTLWTVALFVPGGAWGLNFLVRHALKMHLSAGADWLLLLIAFDAGGVLTADEFRRFVTYPLFHDELRAVFTLLGLVAVAGWVITLLYIERGMRPNEDRLSRIFQQEPKSSGLLFFAASVVLIVVSGAHMLLFTWKGLGHG